MTALATTDALFFEKTGLDRDKTLRRVEDALHGADDGELYLEYTQTEALTFDDGHNTGIFTWDYLRRLDMNAEQPAS